MEAVLLEITEYELKTDRTMYYPRHYRCLACGKKFTLSDGVIMQPSAGVPCPHCGSHKTTGRLLGNVIVGVKDLLNK